MPASARLIRTALRCAALKAAEKASGVRWGGHTGLQVLIDFLRRGNTLVITRIDRLARSLKDLQDIMLELKEEGGQAEGNRAADRDTATAAGKAFLDVLGVFAEFERERQLEAIAAAKARGAYKGRKSIINATEVRRLSREEKLDATGIALRLGRASIYRVLGGATWPVAAVE